MQKRPLSPHLSIYKLPMGAVMSILHRISGAGMFISFSLLSWYFITKTFFGCECEKLAYASYILSILFSLGLFYHLSTGIRHLVWDAGYFLSKEAVFKSNFVCLTLSMLLVVWFWFL